VLEQFPYLSLKYSESYGDRFVSNSPVPCPICNKDQEGENIKNDIKGEWGAGEYYGERAYYLECRDAFNRGIPICKSIEGVMWTDHLPEMRSMISEKFLPKNRVCATE
jgi:hypothetical protein